MAATIKRKQRKGVRTKTGEGGRTRKTFLAERSEARQEQQFEPSTSPGVIISVVLASLAAVAAGAGTYGQWFLPEDQGPHPWAVFLLVGGAALLGGVALFGERPVGALSVGDAGLGSDKDGRPERLPWYEIKSVRIHDDMLTFTASGSAVAISMSAHRDAAAFALAEARQRIPSVVEVDPAVQPRGAVGVTQAVEPAQIAGKHCLASDTLIAFDRDARHCRRCGAYYHRSHVPRQCVACEARLK